MKLLLICNPGGHFSTMMGLKTLVCLLMEGSLTPNLTLKHYVGRKWSFRCKRHECVEGVNFLKALYILRKSQPDLVVSTGASIAKPFGQQIIWHQNSIHWEVSRSRTWAWVENCTTQDEFYVQWPECVKRYPKAHHKGVVAWLSTLNYLFPFDRATNWLNSEKNHRWTSITSARFNFCCCSSSPNKWLFWLAKRCMNLWRRLH